MSFEALKRILNKVRQLPFEIINEIFFHIKKNILWDCFQVFDTHFDIQELIVQYLFQDLHVVDHYSVDDVQINIEQFIALVRKFKVYPQKLTLKNVSTFYVLFTIFPREYRKCKFITLDTKGSEEFEIVRYNTLISKNMVNYIKAMIIDDTIKINNIVIPKNIQSLVIDYTRSPTLEDDDWEAFYDSDIQCLSGLTSLTSLTLHCDITSSDFKYLPSSLIELNLLSVDMRFDTHPLPMQLRSLTMTTTSDCDLDVQFQPLPNLSSLNTDGPDLSTLGKLGLITPTLIDVVLEANNDDDDLWLLNSCHKLRSLVLNNFCLPYGLSDDQTDFPDFESCSIYPSEIVQDLTQKIKFPSNTRSIDVNLLEIFFDFIHFPPKLEFLVLDCERHEGSIVIPDTVNHLILKMNLMNLDGIQFPKNLEICDLSHNCLSRLDNSSLKSLKYLRILNLRFNLFEGIVDKSSFDSEDVIIVTEAMVERFLAPNQFYT